MAISVISQVSGTPHLYTRVLRSIRGNDFTTSLPNGGVYTNVTWSAGPAGGSGTSLVYFEDPAGLSDANNIAIAKPSWATFGRWTALITLDDSTDKTGIRGIRRATGTDNTLSSGGFTQFLNPVGTLAIGELTTLIYAAGWIPLASNQTHYGLQIYQTSATNPLNKIGNADVNYMCIEFSDNASQT